MEFLPRKLLSDDDDEEFCYLHCRYYLPNSCPSDCLPKCPKLCSNLPISDPPPPDYFNYPSSTSKSPHKLSNLVTSTIALLSFTFLLVLCYAIYVRFYSGRRRRRRPDAPPAATHQQEFLDEEQGPVLDHPIWYIRTIGLPPAVISAIAVCKFKSGDGLIDGTECSVCLSEFEEDETLRLLPKCSHAFHLPCIDTWLRSHTTCPMCRAPVVAQSAAVTPPPPPPVLGSEEAQLGDLENFNELERDERDGVDLGESSVRNEEEQDEVGLGNDDLEESVSDIQPVRRSVSLDSVSALGISSVLAVLREKMDSEAELGQRNGNASKKSEVTGCCSAAINRSVSCSGKFLMRSSTHRTSTGTNHN